MKFTCRSVSYPQPLSSTALRCVIVQGSTKAGSVHQSCQCFTPQTFLHRKNFPHSIVITPSQPLCHHVIFLHVKHPLLIKQRNIHLNLSWKTFHFPICSHCCQRYSSICSMLCTIHTDGHFENNHYAHMGPCTFSWAELESSRTCMQFEALFFTSVLVSPYSPLKRARTDTHTLSVQFYMHCVQRYTRYFTYIQAKLLQVEYRANTQLKLRKGYLEGGGWQHLFDPREEQN